MNKRIKELAEQAGFSFKYKTAPDELNPGHKLQDLEKFAELIVRECAEFVRKQNYESMRNEESYNIASTDILNHFGVKE